MAKRSLLEVHTSTSEFVNDTATLFACAVDLTAAQTTLFEGTNKFERNHALYGRAMSVNQTNVTFSGENNFLNKNVNVGGGAVRAIKSLINLRGNQSFIQNSAQLGGAMYLSDDSKLQLTEFLSAVFVEIKQQHMVSNFL